MVYLNAWSLQIKRNSGLHFNLEYCRGQSKMSDKVKVGLFGCNGHQIQGNLENHSHAEIVSVAAYPEERLPEYLKGKVKVCASLAELLAEEEIQLVSLCSPLRSEQAGHAVQCLQAGKHVYAEKPCAMTEADLDLIISTAKETGKIFHEMAGVCLEQPYCTLREIVQSGKIGEVMQVYSQKSYPWFEGRPQDENIDGGLALQVGVYNTRFVEHITGVRIKSIKSSETKLGNEFGGECRRAASFLMELENGGLCSGVANYGCPGAPGWDHWGYETVRIWGTKGFVEAIDNGKIGRLVVNDEELQELDFSTPAKDYLNSFIEEIITGQKVIDFDLEEEISPTRWVIRAKSIY